MSSQKHKIVEAVSDSRQENTLKECWRRIPISILPKKYLKMEVSRGTKMNKILERALTDFPKYEAIMWYSNGTALYKAISCAEIFKRKIPDLHQLTRIQTYTDETKKDSDGDKIIPEIYILLTKDATYEKEDGYQAPGDLGNFKEADSPKEAPPTQEEDQDNSSQKMANFAVVEEFATMGLRVGKKRSRKMEFDETPSKKNKKKRGKDDSQ